MLSVNTIPHLKIYKQKMILPVDKSNANKKSLVVINGKNFDSVKHILTNDKLTIKANYTRLYSERHINTIIYKKSVVMNLRNERETNYRNLKSVRTSPMINGVVEDILKNEFNLFYDISKQNELFFANTLSMNIEKRAEYYLEFISKYINSEKFSGYTTKTMMINTDEWVDNISKDVKSRKNVMNPISCFYFVMLKNPEKIEELKNVDIIFFNTKGEFLRLSPSEIKKDSNKKFLNELFKMNTSLIVENESDAEKLLAQDKQKKEIVKNIMSEYTFGADGKVSEEVEKKIEEKIEEIVEDESISADDAEEVKANLQDDKELIKTIYKMSLEEKTGKVKTSTKRDEELRKKQMEIKLENMTLQEIVAKSSKEAKIEILDVADKVQTTNKNITEIKYPNIDKAYNEQLAQKDLVNIILDLNNKEIPIYVRSVKKEDTSDLLNYKDTYRIELEDANRVRHVLTFDVPKFIDDKFLYLGGNRKMLVHQQTMLPIVKTNPDTVQTCSNYNKIFVRRYGAKVSSEIEKFKKVINRGIAGVNIKTGNYVKANVEYLTTIDYDDLAASYKEIKIDSTLIVFDQAQIREDFKKKNVKIPEGMIPIGFGKGKYLFLDVNNQTVVESKGENKPSDRIDTEMMLISYMTSLSDTLTKEIGATTSGKKYIYTRCTLMKKQVPLALLLSYFEGISKFLKRAEIKHYFSDVRPRVGEDEGVIRFNNGYLVYDKYPFKNSLLMNAFADIPTKSFDYEDFETKGIYVSIFEVMFSRRNIASAFDNFYDNFVDPITLEVLNDLNLPTDITGILLYANELLTDNQYTKETDLSIYRVRCNEVVNAIIYQEVSKAYEKYKATADNANPQKISLPKDAIIKKLQMLQTVEDVSVN